MNFQLNGKKIWSIYWEQNCLWNVLCSKQKKMMIWKDSIEWVAYVPSFKQLQLHIHIFCSIFSISPIIIRTRKVASAPSWLESQHCTDIPKSWVLIPLKPDFFSGFLSASALVAYIHVNGRSRSCAKFYRVGEGDGDQTVIRRDFLRSSFAFLYFTCRSKSCPWFNRFTKALQLDLYDWLTLIGSTTPHMIF